MLSTCGDYVNVDVPIGVIRIATTSGGCVMRLRKVISTRSIRSSSLTSTTSKRSFNRRSSWSICRRSSTFFSWRLLIGRSASFCIARSRLFNVSKLLSSFFMSLRVAYHGNRELTKRSKEGVSRESNRSLLWCSSRLVCFRSCGVRCPLSRTTREHERILCDIYADDVRHCPKDSSIPKPREEETVLQKEKWMINLGSEMVITGFQLIDLSS